MSADNQVLLQFNVLNARNRPDRPIDESKMLTLCKQIEEIWYKKCDSMEKYFDFQAMLNRMKSFSVLSNKRARASESSGNSGQPSVTQQPVGVNAAAVQAGQSGSHSVNPNLVTSGEMTRNFGAGMNNRMRGSNHPAMASSHYHQGILLQQGQANQMVLPQQQVTTAYNSAITPPQVKEEPFQASRQAMMPMMAQGNGYHTANSQPIVQNTLGTNFAYTSSQLPLQQQSLVSTFVPVSQGGAMQQNGIQSQYMSNGAPVLLRGAASAVSSQAGLNMPSHSYISKSTGSLAGNFYAQNVKMENGGMVPVGNGMPVGVAQPMVPVEASGEVSQVKTENGLESILEGNGSQKGTDVASSRREQILKQQRWLLFLRHCAKCDAIPGECQYKQNCAVAKKLWQHLVKCKDPNCEYPRCAPSRTLLKHHQECKSADCPVCAPVKQYVQKQREAMINKKLSSNGMNDAERRKHLEKVRARRQAQAVELAKKNASGIAMSHAYSVGDMSGPIIDPQAEKKPKLLLQENMGTSLLEYFSLDLIERHLKILSEPHVANQCMQKKPSAANLEMPPLVEEESECKVCQQNTLLFEAPSMYCYRCSAKIKRNQTYYSPPRSCEIRATWCHSCISTSGSTIQLESFLFQKEDMEKKKNNAISEEAWVQCDNCEGWVHQICGLFNKGRNDDSRGFLCPQCLLTGLRIGKRAIPETRPQAMLTARDLPRCRLSDVLEERLNAAIEKERDARAFAMNVHPSTLETVTGLTVRVVNNVEKKNEVKPRFANEFCQDGRADAYIYKQKVILLFQEVDGVDMCLFCMYMQEYGDDCPAPNNRTVYLSYLDSVKYFMPDNMQAHGLGVAFRTYIYHELLIGYLSDAKARGFCSMYIWACPPLAGDDYIMYCHPGKQKLPRSDRLREWYLSMLKRAKDEEIVVYISNLFDTFFQDGRDHRLERPSVTDLPYLEGDYWPGEAENLLATGEATTIAQASASGRGRKIGKDKRIRLPDDAGPGEVLLARLGDTIQGMKADFLVAHMYESCSHCREYMDGTKRYYHPNPPAKVVIKSEKVFDGISLDNPGGESSRSVQLLRYQLCEKCYNRECGKAEDSAAPVGLPTGISLDELIAEDCPPIPPNNDPDPIMDSEFFDTRLQFLSLCQGNHYQFDTLRRARHSSMMVLYHLHNPSEPAFSATCNICQAEVSPGQGYRCQQCQDFDMCCACYENPNVTHEHPLTPPDQKTFDERRMRLTTEDKQRRERALQETLRLLIHASECRNAQCAPNCMKIKGLFRHAVGCKKKITGGCTFCRKMWALLQAHSKLCTVSNCRVPRCRELRAFRRQQAARQEDKRREAYRNMLKKQQEQALQVQTSQSQS
jgi:E1A/CREB-binding protein